MTVARSFVLVHGAWHGGWCWGGVADILRAKGHRVTTPTQTGLGERVHLLTDDVDFDTFVLDIINHVECEDLENVVLVGHSFGASVIAAVCDRIPERFDRLIFLDGLLPESGRSAMDMVPADVAARRMQGSQQGGRGRVMPVPDVFAFGIKDESRAKAIARKLTPHPLRTYLTKIVLAAPVGARLPCDYIACTNPRYAGIGVSFAAALRRGWPVHELPYGHDAMLEAPAATADLLLKIVQ